MAGTLRRHSFLMRIHLSLSRVPGRSRLALAAAALTALTAVVAVPSTAAAERRPVKLSKSTELGDEGRATLESYQRWVDSSQPIAWLEFVNQRDEFAHDVAAATEIDGDALAAEWAASDLANQLVVVAALSQLGVPYSYATMREGESFDCSGLTMWAYQQAGVELPRVSGDQIRSAEIVDEADAEPGDLVHYPGHIGLYLGQGGFIDAPNTGNVVRVHALPRKTVRFGDATPDVTTN